MYKCVCTYVYMYMQTCKVPPELAQALHTCIYVYIYVYVYV